MSMSISMVALGPGAKFSLSAFQQEVRETWPGLPEATDVDKGKGVFMFNLGTAKVIFGIMPAPIPWGDLEGPCATSWLWPDAEEVMRSHKGHMIITVADDEVDALARIKLLTQITASFVKVCDASVGVYYGDATLVISPELYREIAVEALPDEIPLFIWVDFRVGPGDDGKMCGFTHGLTPFGVMEMETVNSPETPGDLRERLMDLAGYLIENGPVIEDGHTVGRDENERILVSHTDSAFGHEGQVMRLDYEPAKKKKGWFGRG